MATGPAPTGLGHLIGAYSDDSGEEGDADNGGPQGEAKGADVDDKVKDFLAALETDGLLEEGAEAVDAECTAEDGDVAQEAEGGSVQEGGGTAVAGEEAQQQESVSAGERAGGQGEEGEAFAEEGWQAVLDPGSGEYYYWNTITLATTWDKPRLAKRRRVGEATDSEGKAVREHGHEVQDSGVADNKEQIGGVPDDVTAGSVDEGGVPSQPPVQGASPMEAASTEAEIVDATLQPQYTQAQDAALLPEGVPSSGVGMETVVGIDGVEKGPEADADEEGASQDVQCIEATATLDGVSDASGQEDCEEGSATRVDEGARGLEDVGVADIATVAGASRGDGEVSAMGGAPVAKVDTEGVIRRTENVPVSRLLREGEALVQGLQDEAGVSLPPVSPLARVAIEVEAVMALVEMLQSADSVDTFWGCICGHLLRLFAVARQLEEHSTVEEGEAVRAAHPLPNPEVDVEALLEEVEPSGKQHKQHGPTSSEAIRPPLFPLSRATLPSKAELLQRKAADVQKRLAALAAFHTAPMTQPPSAAAVLTGLAEYSSDMEDGEIAVSKETPSRMGGVSGERVGDGDGGKMDGAESEWGLGAAANSTEQGLGVEGQLATQPSGSSAAPIPGAEDWAYGGHWPAPDSHLDLQPPPPQSTYDGFEAPPERPVGDTSYDPFADLPPPPLPLSPTPTDTWQQTQSAPPSETASMVGPSSTSIPDPSVVSAAAPAQLRQGAVLSAPPVRIPRPTPASAPLSKADHHPQSLAEAAAAAAAAAARGPKKAKAKKGTAVPVGLGVSSAKRVSSLIGKWKAAAQEGSSAKDVPVTAEEVQRKKAEEVEAWRRQQIASGEADKNANFAPVEGDWRKRVKKAQKQAEKEAACQSGSASPAPSKPDLLLLAEGLPAGWQPFLDPASGDVYYGNLQTSATSWSRPEAPEF